MRGLGHSREREPIQMAHPALCNHGYLKRPIGFTNIFIMDNMQSVDTAFNTSGVLNTATGIDTALSSVTKAVWSGRSVGRIIFESVSVCYESS